jgi:hypothetical protein
VVDMGPKVLLCSRAYIAVKMVLLKRTYMYMYKIKLGIYICYMLYIHYIGTSSKMSAQTLKKTCCTQLTKISMGPLGKCPACPMGMR